MPETPKSPGTPTVHTFDDLPRECEFHIGAEWVSVYMPRREAWVEPVLSVNMVDGRVDTEYRNGCLPSAIVLRAIALVAPERILLEAERIGTPAPTLAHVYSDRSSRPI